MSVVGKTEGKHYDNEGMSCRTNNTFHVVPVMLSYRPIRGNGTIVRSMVLGAQI